MRFAIEEEIEREAGQQAKAAAPAPRLHTNPAMGVYRLSPAQARQLASKRAQYAAPGAAPSSIGDDDALHAEDDFAVTFDMRTGGSLDVYGHTEVNGEGRRVKLGTVTGKRFTPCSDS